MMKLAYFSPLPPAHTGIADYSAELLPHLAALTDLILFHPEPEQVAAAIRTQFPIQPLTHYPAHRWQFDLALYQMGNSTHHTTIYQMALRYPGAVVLHDVVLHHFVEAITRRQGDEAGYLQAIGYALGEENGSLWAYLEQKQRPTPYSLTPLNQMLVDRSLLVLVHSRYGQYQLQAQGSKTPVAVIAQPMEPVAASPHRLNWPEDRVVFAALGQVTAAKQVVMALRAFARLRPQCPSARFLIVGEIVQAEVDVAQVIEELQLQEVVQITGFVPDLAEFTGWIAAADIIINLRYPTAGETSATALRGMAQGKPVIVFDHGWYSELPDAAALKLPSLDEEALYQAMLTLAQSAAQRQQMGYAAAHHIQTYHQPATVAAAIQHHLTDLLASLLPRHKKEEGF
jgi:glycosyltransferase involved in cell wall biosynthesis